MIRGPLMSLDPHEYHRASRFGQVQTGSWEDIEKKQKESRTDR